jgi:hypothetical protein
MYFECLIIYVINSRIVGHLSQSDCIDVRPTVFDLCSLNIFSTHHIILYRIFSAFLKKLRRVKVQVTKIVIDTCRFRCTADIRTLLYKLSFGIGSQNFLSAETSVIWYYTSVLKRGALWFSDVYRPSIRDLLIVFHLFVMFQDHAAIWINVDVLYSIFIWKFNVKWRVHNLSD